MTSTVSRLARLGESGLPRHPPHAEGLYNMTVIEYFGDRYQVGHAPLQTEKQARAFVPLLVAKERESMLFTLGYTGENYALAIPEVVWSHPHSPELTYSLHSPRI